MQCQTDMPEDLPDLPDRIQKTCQMQCQTDMPDRMPEDLPDRMSEDMPDAMPDRYAR